MDFQGFCQKATNKLLIQVRGSWNSGKSGKTQGITFWSKKKQGYLRGSKGHLTNLRGFKGHSAKFRDFCILSEKAEFQVITYFLSFQVFLCNLCHPGKQYLGLL